MHITKHNIRNYVCGVCNKGFKRRDTLIMHQDCHYNIYRYKCTLCPAAFRQKTVLKDHMKVHTVQNPFQCPECSASYRMRSQFKRHCMQLHKISDPYAYIDGNSAPGKAEPEDRRGPGHEAPEQPAQLDGGLQVAEDGAEPDQPVAVRNAVPLPGEPEVV